MLKVATIFVCAFFISFAVGKDIDTSALFTLCTKADPKLNECLKSSIQSALEKFTNGIPQINIPALEPILVEKATIGEGTGTVHVVQNYKNLELHNLMKGTIIKDIDAKVDDKKFTVNIKAFNAKYRMTSDYDFNGRILVLPIVGNGKSEIILDDVDVNIFLQVDAFEKKGKKYGKVSKLTLTLEPKNGHYRFDNLFNGDKRLGDQMNTILNENWRDVFQDVRKGYEDLVATVLTSYIDVVFGNLEYDKLLL